jgi:hypothetical protein
VKRRRTFLLVLLIASCPALFAQTLEVQESSGYVETLLPSVGWRQAVVGRQLPEGAVLTAWLDASARIDFQGDTLAVGPLSRVMVRSIQPGLVRLSMAAGSVRITAESAAFEVECRGFLIRVEKGAFSLENGVLRPSSGVVTVSEPGSPLRSLGPGETFDLLARKTGPVLSNPSP